MNQFRELQFRQYSRENLIDMAAERAGGHILGDSKSKGDTMRRMKII